jgi:hypothetical protein
MAVKSQVFWVVLLAAVCAAVLPCGCASHRRAEDEACHNPSVAHTAKGQWEVSLWGAFHKMTIQALGDCDRVAQAQTDSERDSAIDDLGNILRALEGMLRTMRTFSWERTPGAPLRRGDTSTKLYATWHKLSETALNSYMALDKERGDQSKRRWALYGIRETMKGLGDTMREARDLWEQIGASQIRDPEER